ncbi:hypothetical protein PoB_004526200 [Plakobranchus ocellatus]|uniref:Uncharacterized protein n=1 Tax=Plakobranchus ocellatus TaxID=259542 RepID=A0AAV4BH98_9GAST|nr:hypothetical protein PoB_004526200 [Plakobranchus ocellatus]
MRKKRMKRQKKPKSNAFQSNRETGVSGGEGRGCLFAGRGELVDPLKYDLVEEGFVERHHTCDTEEQWIKAFGHGDHSGSRTLDKADTLATEAPTPQKTETPLSDR